MKTVYTTLALVLLLSVCARSQAQEESGESAAEAEAVSQLNEMCPENWCAEDYVYAFAKIACGDESCTLTFTAERDGKSFEGKVEIDYDEPLIDEFVDLEPGYFERVTDALDEWEDAQGEAG